MSPCQRCHVLGDDTRHLPNGSPSCTLAAGSMYALESPSRRRSLMAASGAAGVAGAQSALGSTSGGTIQNAVWNSIPSGQANFTSGPASHFDVSAMPCSDAQAALAGAGSVPTLNRLASSCRRCPEQHCWPAPASALPGKVRSSAGHCARDLSTVRRNCACWAAAARSCRLRGEQAAPAAGQSWRSQS